MSRPGFNFRLERVRALREHAEDAAKEELASSLSQRVKGEALLRAADAGVHGAREAFPTGGTEALSGADMLAAQAYLERTERAREAAEQDLSRRDAEVSERREFLGERARDRQALERLKDRRQADWKRESLRLEGAALDEMAISRHRRGGAAR